MGKNIVLIFLLLNFQKNKSIMKYQTTNMNNSWQPQHKFDAGTGMKIVFSQWNILKFQREFMLSRNKKSRSENFNETNSWKIYTGSTELFFYNNAKKISFLINFIFINNNNLEPKPPRN